MLIQNTRNLPEASRTPIEHKESSRSPLCWLLADLLQGYTVL